MSLDELKEKFVPYCFTITRALVCAPSYLLFMGFFAPSRYESKLWDLKLHLEKENIDVTHLKTEFADLKTTYRENMSRYFEAFLNTLDEEKAGKLQSKYLYYTRSATDWELLRVQPMRYIWNQTDQLTLYGLILSGVLGINSLLKIEKKENSIHTLLKNRFVHLDTVAIMLQMRGRVLARHDGWKNKWSWYNSIFTSLPKRIKYPLLLINAGNFLYLLGGYKNPRNNKS